MRLISLQVDARKYDALSDLHNYRHAFLYSMEAIYSFEKGDDAVNRLLEL